jgi:hypothetical protein
MTEARRQARVQELYGFSFPDDLFAAWDLALRANAREPLRPFAPPGEQLFELLDVSLVGPFHVLAGEFDARLPAVPMTLHWRHFMDPPEFFTCAKGSVDGLLWGWWFDDPGRLDPWFTSYYTNDAFDLGPPHGRNFFDAARMNIEEIWLGLQENTDGEQDESERDTLFAWLERLRALVVEYGTGDRKETGEEYFDLYWSCRPPREPTVCTYEKMGIVVPDDKWRPLSLTGDELKNAIREGSAVESLIKESELALREGFPGTALALGRELWAFGSRYQDAAFGA